jgi:hypothetical protein
MFRKWVVLLLLVVLCSSTLVASGSSPHFAGGTSLADGALVFSGKLAGLGNSSYTAQLTGYATVTALCQNKGGNIAPGQNRVQVSVSVSSAPFTPDTNGSADITLVAQDPATSLTPPPLPTAQQAGCPNNNWKVVGFQSGSTLWTGAQVNVMDTATQQNVLTLNYSCTGSEATFSCVQV